MQFKPLFKGQLYKNHWSESTGSYLTTENEPRIPWQRGGLLGGLAGYSYTHFPVAGTNFILFPGAIIRQIPDFLH